MTDRQSQEPVVPVGLEQVLLMAGLEPRFAEALRNEPEAALAALAASGVALSASERAILRTVPGQRLEHMAARVIATVEEPTRRAFLGQASAVVAALGGGAGLAAGCAEKKSNLGTTGPTQEGASDIESMAMTMARRRTVQRRHREVVPTGIRPGPWPHTTVGEPKIEGPIDPKSVKQRLKAYSYTVGQCWFGKGRRHVPRGTIRLELTVDGEGKVKKASFGTGTRNKNEIETCILAAAKQWRFPPSKPRPSTIQVSYTFEYR